MKWILIPGFIITWIIIGFLSYIAISACTKENWREDIIDGGYTWLAFILLWPVLDPILALFGIVELFRLLFIKIAKETKHDDSD